MAFKSPPEITAPTVQTGTKQAPMPRGQLLPGSFLPGSYIAFAGLLAVVTSAGLDPEKVGGVVTLITGSVFAMGLVLVIIAGSVLLTGNFALVPLAGFARRITVGRTIFNFSLVTVGNLIG